MRTNIVINDDLMKAVLFQTGYKTQKEAVHKGLEILLKLEKQKSIRNYKGKLRWTGNLKSMREG